MSSSPLSHLTIGLCQGTCLTGRNQSIFSFHSVGSEDGNPAAMDILSCAICESRELTFLYRKPGERRPEQRTVNPYHLACIDNRWYLIANDIARAGLRKFALTRLTCRQLTGRRFLKPANFDPEQYLRSAFAAMTGDRDYEVVIDFDAWATDIMRGCRWHPTQQITELPAGGSHFRVRVACLEEIERWVLSWGIHATVLSPTQLADQVTSVMRALVQRCAEPATGEDLHAGQSPSNPIASRAALPSAARPRTRPPPPNPNDRPILTTPHRRPLRIPRPPLRQTRPQRSRRRGPHRPRLPWLHRGSPSRKHRPPPAAQPQVTLPLLDGPPRPGATRPSEADNP